MSSTVTKPFSELNLHPDLMAGLARMGYDTATPVQTASIPTVQTGRDLMVQARTGTGKTLGFGLPTLQRIDPTSPDTQVLVILPTRELALQVADELSRVAEDMQIIVAAVFGGVKIETQIDKMQWAPVVVGTPGRLRDHIERGYLHLDTCKVVVLDEADEMLDMGFKDDLEFILKKVPAEQRQTLLFSATFPPEITKIAHKYMRDPEKIEVSSGYTPATGLIHKFARIDKNRKIEALATLLGRDDVQSAIIFCETKSETAWVHQRLKVQKLPIGILNGDIPQERRLTTLQSFRDGELKYLVATDVAARGLDIPAVSHVFHFTVPQDTATYVHRSGRTARAGKSGTAFTLVTSEEERDYQRIMRDIKQASPQGNRGDRPAPTDRSADRPERGERNDREPRRNDRDARPPRGEGRELRNDRQERPDREPRPETADRGNRQQQGQQAGNRPGQRGRLSPALASTAGEVFAAVLAETPEVDAFRGLVDALFGRNDTRRVIAALFAQSSQADAWREALAAAADEEDEAGDDAGFGQREGGRRRRRGGRGRGGRNRDRGERDGDDRADGDDRNDSDREVPAAPVVKTADAAPTRTRRSVPASAPAEAAAPATPNTDGLERPPVRRTTRKVAEAAPAEEVAPVKRTRTTKKVEAEAPAAEVAEKPKRVTRAKKTETEAPAAEAAEKPKRVTRAKKAVEV